MKQKVKELVYSTLRDYGYREKDTEIFKSLKHNKDLVPRFSKNLNYLVECCGKYGNASYDIQGIKDGGVDVIVKYLDETETTKYIGLQIKSYDDISEKDWLVKLKAQMFESESKYKLEDFYIIFCTDSEIHKDKIRNAFAELISHDRKNIHLVEPEKALNFYNLSQIEIVIKVQREYCTGDVVFEDSKNSLDNFSLVEACIIIDIAVDALIGGKYQIEIEDLFYNQLTGKVLDNYINVSKEFFNLNHEEMNDAIPEYQRNDEDSWENVVSLFESSVYEALSFKLNEMWSLSALILDIKVRYNLDVETMKDYLYSFLLEEKIGIAETFLTKT